MPCSTSCAPSSSRSSAGSAGTPSSPRSRRERRPVSRAPGVRRRAAADHRQRPAQLRPPRGALPRAARGRLLPRPGPRRGRGARAARGLRRLGRHRRRRVRAAPGLPGVPGVRLLARAERRPGGRRDRLPRQPRRLGRGVRSHRRRARGPPRRRVLRLLRAAAARLRRARARGRRAGSGGGRAARSGPGGRARLLRRTSSSTGTRSVTRFSDELRAAAEPIWAAQHAHPFVRGIGDGTLDPDAFRVYVRQDYLFLAEYGRLLALASARAPRLELQRRFADLAREVLGTEMELHRGYAAEWGISAAELEARARPRRSRAPTPTSCSGSPRSATSPSSSPRSCPACGATPSSPSRCRGPDDELYARWVDAYAGPQFQELAAWCREVCDEVAGDGRPRPDAGRLPRVEPPRAGLLGVSGRRAGRHLERVVRWPSGVRGALRPSPRPLRVLDPGRGVPDPGARRPRRRARHAGRLAHRPRLAGRRGRAPPRGAQAGDQADRRLRALRRRRPPPAGEGLRAPDRPRRVERGVREPDQALLARLPGGLLLQAARRLGAARAARQRPRRPLGLPLRARLARRSRRTGRRTPQPTSTGSCRSSGATRPTSRSRTPASRRSSGSTRSWRSWPRRPACRSSRPATSTTCCTRTRARTRRCSASSRATR